MTVDHIQHESDLIKYQFNINILPKIIHPKRLLELTNLTKMKTLSKAICQIFEGEDIEKLCADVILINTENKILLLKRNIDAGIFPNKWGLPGGHCQDDETIEQGAARECLEESGIVTNKLNKIVDWTFPDGFKSTFFFARAPKDFDPDAPVSLSSEHTDFKWVTLENAYNMNTCDNLNDVLKYCFNYIETNNS